MKPDPVTAAKIREHEARRCSTTPPPAEEPSRLGEADSTLDALSSVEGPKDAERLLRRLAAELNGTDKLARETARERAIEALKGKVSSPARMVDAALGDASSGAEDGKQGRRLELPEPKPWPEPVDGAELLDSLAATFHRFLALPDGAAEAMALWAVFTHSLDAFDVAPVLALMSPVKRCGKTTALRLLQRLVERPLPSSNILPASLFRSVEKWGPTLLVDEADTFLRNSDELRGILNSGHTRDAAFVVRSVGDDHEPRLFGTWGAKAIALIGRLPDTLEDRSITVPMRRKAMGEHVARFRPDRHGSELAELSRKAARWAADNLDALRDTDPEVPTELHDRAADNWRPLLAIADLAGDGWPETAREAAKILNGGDASPSTRELLLADIRTVFEEGEGVEEDAEGNQKVASTMLAEKLAAMEGRPWPEWGRQKKPITATAIANQLGGFGIHPGKSGGWRGYKREQFEDSWERYPQDRATTEGDTQDPSVSKRPTARNPISSRQNPESRDAREAPERAVGNSENHQLVKGDGAVGRFSRGGNGGEGTSGGEERWEGDV